MPKNSNQSKASNYSIKFDSGDWMELAAGDETTPDFKPFTPVNDKFSISCWVKFDSATPATNEYIVNNASYGGGTKWAFDLSSTGYLRFSINVSGVKRITSDSALSADVWYHLGGHWEGTNINIYINGT